MSLDATHYELKKGIHPNVMAIGLTIFFTDISTKMVYSVMPMFLMSIGASKTSISLIEGIAESTAALIKAISGYWSDKIGRSKPFYFSTATALAASLLMTILFCKKEQSEPIMW